MMAERLINGESSEPMISLDKLLKEAKDLKLTSMGEMFSGML
jgi:hypothetical protein